MLGPSRFSPGHLSACSPALIDMDKRTRISIANTKAVVWRECPNKARARRGGAAGEMGSKAARRRRRRRARAAFCPSA